MEGTFTKCKIRAFLWMLLCAMCLLGGCSTAPVVRKELPPLLTQDEVVRPYQKVAVLEVQRNRYGSPDDISPQDYAWVYEALRQEASKIGADAVILPEVHVEVDNFFLFPSSKMRGRGVAIKFQ